jgi:hypothetical protein
LIAAAREEFEHDVILNLRFLLELKTESVFNWRALEKLDLAADLAEISTLISLLHHISFLDALQMT